MEKRSIVITGSTRGIGYGMAREFLSRGHRVVINGRSREQVESKIKELKSFGPDVTGIHGSVDLEDTHLKIIDHAVKAFDNIDIWINNAGIPQPHRPFSGLDQQSVRNLIDTNITGLMIGTLHALNFMKEQGHGKIFNMEGFGSDGRMRNNLTLYGTSKRAVHYFTKSISMEEKGGAVQIGIISPGMVRTEFLDQSIQFGSPKERKQFDKVYRVLAEDVEVVTPFLVKGMLKSERQYDRIAFLSGIRLTSKIIRLMFS